MSEALVFEIIKKHHSQLKKRNGRTNRSGSILFSTEAGNVKNLHTPRFSGLSKSQTVDISAAGADASPVLTLKVASKAASKPSKARRVIPLSSKNMRKSIKSIAAVTSGVYYRNDLAALANARYAKVFQGHKIAAGIKKGLPVKAGRN